METERRKNEKGIGNTCQCIKGKKIVISDLFNIYLLLPLAYHSLQYCNVFSELRGIQALNVCKQYR